MGAALLPMASCPPLPGTGPVLGANGGPAGSPGLTPASFRVRAPAADAVSGQTATAVMFAADRLQLGWGGFGQAATRQLSSLRFLVERASSSFSDSFIF